MKNLYIQNKFLRFFFAFFLTLGTAIAQDKSAESAADLAKKLSNPIASLISVPFQNNTDVSISPYNGSRNTLNFQPVIPISISEKWNMVSRISGITKLGTQMVQLAIGPRIPVSVPANGKPDFGIRAVVNFVFPK